MKQKSDPRDPVDVLSQYANRYVAKKSKPSPDKGDPNLILNKEIIYHLLDGLMSNSEIKKFIKLFGIEDNSVYYSWVKNNYLDRNAYLIHVDSEQKQYIDELKKIIV